MASFPPLRSISLPSCRISFSLCDTSCRDHHHHLAPRSLPPSARRRLPTGRLSWCGWRTAPRRRSPAWRQTHRPSAARCGPGGEARSERGRTPGHQYRKSSGSGRRGMDRASCESCTAGRPPGALGFFIFAVDSLPRRVYDTATPATLTSHPAVPARRLMFGICTAPL